MQLLSRAKINLSLKILGQRPDGYHSLDTVMVPLALADTIFLGQNSATSAIELTCSDPTIPQDATNLAWKAAAAYQSALGRSFGVKIHLEKKIPHGAGLGGGSSNAATVLLGLNALAAGALTQAQLYRLAGELGADVAFFLQSAPARCQGRGEQLSPAPLIPDWPILLIKPPFAVPTAWAYQAYAKNKKEPASRLEIDGWVLENDLEAPVFAKYLLLPILRDWLLNHPAIRAVQMSGSGSTLFAILDKGQPDAELRETLRDRFGASLWVERTQIHQPTVEI